MRRVIKIGGSLLARPDLKPSLDGWLASQPPAENICIVGGGELIDAMRRLDEFHPGQPESIHWMCVDLLRTTFRLVATWFHWPTIEDSGQLRAQIATGFRDDVPTLIEVSTFYHRQRPTDRLPHDWRTTTDAIAAYLAAEIDADELVLLKSCAVDPQLSFEELAARGIVDEAFPEIAESISRVRIELVELPDQRRCRSSIRPT